MQQSPVCGSEHTGLAASCVKEGLTKQLTYLASICVGETLLPKLKNFLWKQLPCLQKRDADQLILLLAMLGDVLATKQCHYVCFPISG